MMAIIAFLSVTNTLFPVPVDKAVFLLVSGICVAKYSIKRSYLSIGVCWLFLWGIAFLMNLRVSNSAVMMFFPVIGTLFAIYGRRIFTLQTLYLALLLYFIVAAYFLACAYRTRYDLFAHFLYDKGLPSLAAPMGFAASTQPFGTLCLAWLLLYKKKSEDHEAMWWDRIALVFVMAMMISTFNRMTYVSFVFYIMIRRPKTIIPFVLLVVILSILYSDTVSSVLGAAGTLRSRMNYFDHYVSTVSSGNAFQLLFGQGDSQVHDRGLLEMNGNQPLIENGLFAVLFTYGLFTLVAIALALAVYLLRYRSINDLKDRIYLSYFILPAQFLTNEYLSTTFYFFIMVFLLTRSTAPKFRAAGGIDSPVSPKLDIRFA